MEKKINVAELLKDCPSGMELDCTLFNKPVKFDGIDKDYNLYPIRVKIEDNIKWFDKYGCIYSKTYAKCVIYPKGKTTWDGFHRPFKDGDVLSYQCKGFENRTIYIYMNHSKMNTTYYVALSGSSDSEFMINNQEGYALNGYNDTVRHATEEEKQKLFQAIKDNGYKWNAETKTLEKLIEPKFKVGDRIKNKNSGICDKVIKIFEDCYLVESCLDEQATIGFDIQDNWVLAPNKFDISTLKPFDKVLVRDSYKNMWCASIFSHTWKDKYFCIGAWYNQCIPYEANKELLGTTNDCGLFYKNWEEE